MDRILTEALFFIVPRIAALVAYYYTIRIR